MYQQDKEYECPNPECGEWLNPNDFSGNIHCPECHKVYHLDVDYDFPGDGSGWKDKSKLIEVWE